jgi:putative transposase
VATGGLAYHTLNRGVGRRMSQKTDEPALLLPPADWPCPPPPDWQDVVNRAETHEELAALRCSIQRGTPYGGPQWVARTAKRLGLESTLRPHGRPRQAATRSDSE